MIVALPGLFSYLFYTKERVFVTFMFAFLLNQIQKQQNNFSKSRSLFRRKINKFVRLPCLKMYPFPTNIETGVYGFSFVSCSKLYKCEMETPFVKCAM